MRKLRFFLLIMGLIAVGAIIVTSYYSYQASRDPKLELQVFTAEISPNGQTIQARFIVENSGDETSEHTSIWVQTDPSTSLVENTVKIPAGKKKTIILEIDIAEFAEINSFEIWGAVEYGTHCCAIQLETEHIAVQRSLNTE